MTTTTPRLRFSAYDIESGVQSHSGYVNKPDSRLHPDDFLLDEFTVLISGVAIDLKRGLVVLFGPAKELAV